MERIYNPHDSEYLEVLDNLYQFGDDRGDRTGTGTRGGFGHQMRFNLEAGFPLLTTKKVYWKGVVHELLWFLSGSTNIKYLQDNNVHIWDDWADENGELGPVYGSQWRTWPTRDGGHIDQIKGVIRSIKHNPESRRHIVTAWNPEDVDKMALPPCHTLFQFYVCKGKLSLHLYQRSADMFLGVPFNIASYALLLHMVAHATHYEVGEFIHTLGDAHIYLNHFDQVKEQLSREPRESPKLWLNMNVKDIFEMTFDDITLQNYDPHPAIKADVSV